MVVGVLEILLNDVVIDILDADLGLDPIQLHRFELQHDQCASRVLRQRLVDANSDFLTRLHVAVYQVRLRSTFAQHSSSSSNSNRTMISVIDPVGEYPSHSLGAGQKTPMDQ